MKTKNIKMYTRCLEQNLTLKELSKRIGLSAVFLSKVQTGEQKPSLENATKIANELNMDVNELFPILGCKGHPKK